nr:ribonuclease H-like domain-containing protein [Tanacetum cinerariifolium]
LGRPFLRTARALIDFYGEEMILRDGDESLTLNMKHDTASYSNHPYRESVNLINIFNLSSEDCLKDLVSHKQSGNPTFSLHKEIASPEVISEIHDSKGCTFLSEELPDINSFNDIHPYFHGDPLSGSTTYSANSLLEEFTDELALISYPPDYDDYRVCDIESDIREIEFLLFQGEDSDFKDSIDQSVLTNLDDLFVDPTPEMFVEEQPPDYSFPLRFDVYPDDFLEIKSDANFDDDSFDSEGEKIKEAELLIDPLDLPCDILSEYDSFNSQDFSRDDVLFSPDNEDKEVIVNSDLVSSVESASAEGMQIPYEKQSRIGLEATRNQRRCKRPFSSKIIKSLLQQVKKVYESEIKGQSSSSSISHNVAFVSSDNTSSTNKTVNTTHSGSDASAKDQASTGSYDDDVIFSFFSHQSNALQLDNEDLEYNDTDDLEEIDLKWQVAEEELTNFALMAYTSQGSSSSDSEESDSEDENVFEPKEVKKIVKPSLENIEFVNARYITVENENKAKKPRKFSQSHRGNKINWNGLMMTQKLGDGFDFNKKDCFVCGSINHLIKDYDFYENKMVLNNKGKITGPKEIRPIRDNTSRVNQNNKLTQPHAKRNFVPAVVLTKFGQVPVNAAKQSSYRVAASVSAARRVNTVASRPNVNNALPITYSYFKAHSLIIKKLMVDLLHLEEMLKELLDESQVLLKVCRNNNMYSFDLKNIVPVGGPTCLFAKATLYESNLWHRMLGHINFKTMNKLVRGNLVSGLPSKLLKMTIHVLLVKRESNTKPQVRPRLKSGLSFMRQFGCLVTILNTLDHLGIGPNWMFDIDTLTMSMNYHPVFAGNQTNGYVCAKANINAGQAGKKIVLGPQYVLLPLLTSDSLGPKSSEDEVANDAEKKSTQVSRKENGVQDLAKEVEKNDQEKDVRDQEEAIRKQFKQESKKLFGQGEAANTNSTNRFNTVSSPVNADANGNRMVTLISAAGSTYVNIGGSIPVNVVILPNANLPTDPLMPDLEDTADLQDTRIFSGVYDDQVEGVEANFNNMELTIENDQDFSRTCYEPKKVIQALRDPTWIEAMQDELLEFRLQKVWRLVDLPKGKHTIRTKWVYENKKDKRGIVVRNKARLAAQGYTQEEGIDYDKISAFVARIEVIRLFLAYALFMGFLVYQMDVQSAFLYGIIAKEVIDAQEVPDELYRGAHFLLRVIVKTSSTPIETNNALLKDEEAKDVDVQLYKLMIGSLMYLTTSRPDIMFVVCACARFQVTRKVLHLHALKRIFRYLKGQPKLGLWYPRDSPFDLKVFLDSDYARASLDRKPTESKGFEQMIDFVNASYVKYALTYIVHKVKKVNSEAPFIRDAYEKKLIQVLKIYTDDNVDGLLTNAFDVSRSSKKKMPLVKDEEAADVDVHLYRSMIGSLMYLIASRPDIMFAVYACS